MSFNQNFQTISEFLAEIPVMKMRYWSLNLIILEGDRSNNIIQKPWNMAIFWVPLEIGCSKLGEFLLKETTYSIVPYNFFFSYEATLDNTQNVRPSVPWWLMEFPEFYNSRYMEIIECLITKCSQYFHNIQSIFEHYLHNICTIFEQYLHNICTIFAQYFYNICTIFLKYLHIICRIFGKYLHKICTTRLSCFNVKTNCFSLVRLKVISSLG